jgi:hypothetical protein
MMNRWVWALSVFFLTTVIAGSFLYPHAMVSPGKLMAAHRDIEQNCFACHSPFTGVSDARCATCHVPSDIGLRSTKGVALVHKQSRVPFHQALIETNCTSCHSDHLVASPGQETPRRFHHRLLKPDLRGRCQSCHTAPKDPLHADPRPSTCRTCHSTAGWKPSSFDHSKYFPLTGDHNVGCLSCHAGNNFKTYTCVSCHAHEKSRMIQEHLEEGIRNIDNCVSCHTARGLKSREGSENGDDD